LPPAVSVVSLVGMGINQGKSAARVWWDRIAIFGIFLGVTTGVGLFARAQDVAKDNPGPASQPAMTVWVLDNLKSVGGNVPEVIGQPQVVTTPMGPAMHFNGESDGLLLSVNPINGWAAFTMEMLIKPEAGGPKEQRFLHVEDGDGNRGTMELRMLDKGWALDTFLLAPPARLTLLDQTKLHPADQWTWVALVYQNGKMTSYINGAKELEGVINMVPMGDGKISLGVRQNHVSWFKGLIREVRFHAEALPADRLQRASQK
jgi:hypothetical protein